jgi:heme/copper-type cytochrome/quinol oxidase subunit 3
MTKATSEAITLPGGVTAEPGMGINNQKLGMWVFLTSEVMFFTGLIGAYIVLRFGTAAWALPGVPLEEGGTPLNINLTAANTFMLICSSVTMVKAFASIEHGDQKKLQLYLLATVLLGAAFVGVQVYEYLQLAGEGFLPACGEHLAAVVPNCNLFASTFYTMTGFHGTHVSIGVLCMIWVTVKAFRGSYTKESHSGVEVVGLYWHFVDLVWILLFTIVYLI